MDEYWKIDEGEIESSQFFRLLGEHFPNATTFYAEGTSIAPDVIQLHEHYHQEGDYLPGQQISWPKSRKFRCHFSIEFMTGLAGKAAFHAEPELLDHLFIYRANEPLFEWHDAFANAILISRKVPESTVAAIAQALGQKYAKA